MTTTLKDLLAEYAEEARPYDVRVQALRVGRRRRRLRRAIPAALVLLAVVTIGLTQLIPQPSPTGPSLPGTRVDLPGYPAAVVMQQDAPPLPTDAPVGPALMLYTYPGDGYRLVLPGGDQYRLEGSLAGEPWDATYDLSPNRRWLFTAVRGQGTTVRDLTGTATAEFPGLRHPVSASADGRWLVLGTQSDNVDASEANNPGVVELVDLTANPPVGVSVDLTAYLDCVVAAVRSDGSLVIHNLGAGSLGSLIIFNPHNGDVYPVDIDLSGHASAGELDATAYIADYLARGRVPNPLLLASDDTAWLRLHHAFGGPVADNVPVLPTDVLVLRLDQHVVQQRLRLPEPRAISGDRGGDWEFWFVLTVSPEGLLLLHRTTHRMVAVELYDPATGKLSLVTDLRGLSSVEQ